MKHSSGLGWRYLFFLILKNFIQLPHIVTYLIINFKSRDGCLKLKLIKVETQISNMQISHWSTMVLFSISFTSDQLQVTVFLASEHKILVLSFSQDPMDISEKQMTGYLKRLIMKFQPILKSIVILGFGLEDPSNPNHSMICKPRADSCTKESLPFLSLQLDSLRQFAG